MQRMRKYIAVLVLALGLLAGSATTALASHGADYDGYSWEDYYSGSIDSVLGVTSWRWSGDWVQEWYGAAYWYYHPDGYSYWYPANYYWRIYWDNYTWYDSGEMNYYGAGSYDWYRLYAHERAHQEGWHHYQGSPSYNAAYDPYINLCGC